MSWGIRHNLSQMWPAQIRHTRCIMEKSVISQNVFIQHHMETTRLYVIIYPHPFFSGGIVEPSCGWALLKYSKSVNILNAAECTRNWEQKRLALDSIPFIKKWSGMVAVSVWLSEFVRDRWRIKIIKTTIFYILHVAAYHLVYTHAIPCLKLNFCFDLIF